jgi:hypothetical protein
MPDRGTPSGRRARAFPPEVKPSAWPALHAKRDSRPYLRNARAAIEAGLGHQRSVAAPPRLSQLARSDSGSKAWIALAMHCASNVSCLREIHRRTSSRCHDRASAPRCFGQRRPRCDLGIPPNRNAPFWAAIRASKCGGSNSLPATRAVLIAQVATAPASLALSLTGPRSSIIVRRTDFARCSSCKTRAGCSARRAELRAACGREIRAGAHGCSARASRQVRRCARRSTRRPRHRPSRRAACG